MLDAFTYWSRAMAGWNSLAETGRRMGRTATAADNVIAARTDLMRDAWSAPWAGDYAELSRMVPEKVAAFTQSGAVAMQALAAMQTAQWDWAQRTLALTMRGTAPTPREALDLWSRTAMDALHTLEAGARTSRRTLAPIHRTATNNARRLAKRKG